MRITIRVKEIGPWKNKIQILDQQGSARDYLPCKIIFYLRKFTHVPGLSSSSYRFSFPVFLTLCSYSVFANEEATIHLQNDPFGTPIDAADPESLSNWCKNDSNQYRPRQQHSSVDRSPGPCSTRSVPHDQNSDTVTIRICIRMYTVDLFIVIELL